MVSARLETLFRHVTNEATDTRALVWERIEDLRREIQEIEARTNELVDPAMTTVAEASTLLQHVALRVERRLVDLGGATGAEPGLAGLATTRAAVEVPFALAALGRVAPGGPVVVLGPLPLLALFTASAGHPTTLVGAGASPHPGVCLIDDEAGWPGPPAPAALVVRSLPRALLPADAERIVAGQAWLDPGGRLVLGAPAGRPGADGDGGAALALLGEAGWSVAHRSALSLGSGGWSSAAAVPAPGDLVLVELARAASAG